tara:strand:- start:315 stop:566 length:252 start_codon:yes stop_codon:yes gene_type:complete
MNQNKIDKNTTIKVFEKLKNNEEKNKIHTNIGDYPKKLIIGSGTSFEGTAVLRRRILKFTGVLNPILNRISFTLVQRQKFLVL